MKRFLLLWLILSTMIISCEKEPKFMSPSQIEEEEKLIIQVNEKYHQASEQKNFGMMIETLADEVTFFGTDSSEIITSFAQFQQAMNRQWEEYDQTVYGEMVNIHIKMDPRGKLASIMFGVPLKVTRQGITNEYYVRVARTLEKEGANWKIVSGIVGIVRDAEAAQSAHEKEQEAESE